MVALSVVVPCYNEQECLHELHRRASAVARRCYGDDYELLLVNDGSRDATWPMMQALAAGDPNLVCVNLSRNHGQQLALTAGLHMARGQLVLIIDADLQDPPEVLPAMIETMIAEEADVVYGVRAHRDGETMFKKATSSLFYRLLDRLTDVAIPLDTGDFRLITRRALDQLLAMPEQARFVRGMVSWIGYRQVPFTFERAPRMAGETKYPFSKLLSLAFDAITSFSTAPLRLASHAGLWLVVALVVVAAVVLGIRLSGGSVEGWASLALLIIGLGAAQMLVLGVMGEYLGRIYVEAKRRPLFVVSDVVGGRPNTAAPRLIPPMQAPAATGQAASADGQSAPPPAQTGGGTGR